MQVGRMRCVPAYGGNGNRSDVVVFETQPALPQAPLGRSAVQMVNKKRLWRYAYGAI